MFVSVLDSAYEKLTVHAVVALFSQSDINNLAIVQDVSQSDQVSMNYSLFV